jgi:hypothetical protein
VRIRELPGRDALAELAGALAARGARLERAERAGGELLVTTSPLERGALEAALAALGPAAGARSLCIEGDL